MYGLLKFSGKILIALLAVGLTFAILLYLTPSWQKSLAMEFLSRDTERRWQVEDIRLGPNGLQMAGAFVLQDKLGAEIQFLEIKGPLWTAPFSRQVRVESGEVRGVLLDLSQVQLGDTTSTDWQSFVSRVSDDMAFWKERLGLLLRKAEAQGWRVDLEDVSISGEILMPGQRVVPLRLHVLTANSQAPDQVEVQLLRAQAGPVL